MGHIGFPKKIMQKLSFFDHFFLVYSIDIHLFSSILLYSIVFYSVLAGGLEAGALLGVYKARATDFAAGVVLTCL